MGHLTALLLSRDPETQRTISSVLGKVGIQTEMCPAPAPGLRALRSKKFEGVIVDCDDMDCGTDLLTMLRDESFTKTTIVFALVNGRTSMHDAFGMGANFVLEKPLANDRVMRCFRAAQGLMIGERRRYFRHETSFPIYFDFPNLVTNASATVRDISLGGMLVHTTLGLTPEMEGTFRFTFPDTHATVNGSCQLVWKSGDSAGFRFTDLPQAKQLVLEKWLADKFELMHKKVVPIIPDAPDPMLVN